MEQLQNPQREVRRANTSHIYRLPGDTLPSGKHGNGGCGGGIYHYGCGGKSRGDLDSLRSIQASCGRMSSTSSFFGSHGIPSIASSVPLVRVPTLNLGQVKGGNSIVLSSLGLQKKDSAPYEQNAHAIMIDSASSDEVIEHLNKIQDNLNKHLSSVRLQYQQCMSKSAMSGSARKRSSRLMSISPDETHSIISGSPILDVLNYPFENGVKDKGSSMLIGRQETHHVTQPTYLPLRQKLGFKHMYNVNPNEKETPLNGTQLPQNALLHPTKPYMPHGQQCNNATRGTPMVNQRTPAQHHNRNNTCGYNSDRVRGVIRNVCAKEGTSDPPEAVDSSEAPQPQGEVGAPMAVGSVHKDRNNRVGDMIIDSMGNVAQQTHPKSHGSTRARQAAHDPSARGELGTDGGAKPRELGHSESKSGIKLEKVARGLPKSVSNMDMHTGFTMGTSSTPLYQNPRDKHARNHAMRHALIFDQSAPESYRVVSVNGSDVEAVSKQYAEAAMQAMNGHMGSHENAFNRGVSFVGLTHLPSANGTSVKNLSCYTLEHLDKLSKVNTKCALLGESVTQKEGMGTHSDEYHRNIFNVGVKPWFKDPLVEKMRRKHPPNNQYDCYIPSSIANDETHPIYDELPSYMENNATYRLDLDDRECHGVLDPFYEYEKIKQNKAPATSDWAKYGRPVHKN